MKTNVLQSNLRNGLVIIERITAKSVALPVLGNVLVSCDKNFICLSATDLEIAAHFWVLSKTEKEGKITLPAKLFLQLVSSIAEEKVELEVKNNNLIVKNNICTSQLRGQNPEEFPVIPEIKKDYTFELNIGSFCQGLTQIVDVASTSSHKPELTGVYCMLGKKMLILAATDSFRLAEKTLFFADETSVPEGGLSFIIPVKIVRELINVFGGTQGRIKLFLSQNQIAFEYVSPEVSHPQIQLLSRLIEGEYPSYKDIIPQKHDAQFITPKADFINQIKAASYFTQKTNEISLHFIPGKGLEITSQNPDSGEYSALIKGKCDGEEMNIDFNWKFILDGLVNIKSDEIALYAQKNGGPATLCPVGDTSYIYVVMPIRAG